VVWCGILAKNFPKVCAHKHAESNSKNVMALQLEHMHLHIESLYVCVHARYVIFGSDSHHSPFCSLLSAVFFCSFNYCEKAPKINYTSIIILSSFTSCRLVYGHVFQHSPWLSRGNSGNFTELHNIHPVTHGKSWTAHHFSMKR